MTHFPRSSVIQYHGNKFGEKISWFCFLHLELLTRLRQRLMLPCSSLPIPMCLALELPSLVLHIAPILSTHSHPPIPCPCTLTSLSLWLRPQLVRPRSVPAFPSIFPFCYHNALGTLLIFRLSFDMVRLSEAGIHANISFIVPLQTNVRGSGIMRCRRELRWTSDGMCVVALALTAVEVRRA